MPGDLEAVLTAQETLREGLLYAAAAMICGVVLIGAAKELQVGKKRQSESPVTGTTNDPPLISQATSNLMRTMGVFWSIMLLAMYLPAQTKYEAKAKEYLNSYAKPCDDNPKTAEEYFGMRNAGQAAFNMGSGGFSPTVLLTILAPLISGFLPGIGKSGGD